MNELVFKMVVAGVLFGAWPILMSKSGLNGPTSAAVFSIIALSFILPVAFQHGITLTGANWWYALAAGCCGGIGLLVFNSGLAKATPATVGQLFVVMIVVQTAIPAIYSVVMNGQLTLKTGAGFIAAVIAAILLV